MFSEISIIMTIDLPRSATERSFTPPGAAYALFARTMTVTVVDYHDGCVAVRNITVAGAKATRGGEPSRLNTSVQFPLTHCPPFLIEHVRIAMARAQAMFGLGEQYGARTTSHDARKTVTARHDIERARANGEI
jgi:hypothetical protein